MISYSGSLKLTILFWGVLFTITQKNLASYHEYKRFEHLLVEDGLSQSTVFAIYKDQSNFMWFGTRRGLNRYDGFQFKYYLHDVNDSSSLSSNSIFAIIGDKDDNLIVQTEKHLNYYDRFRDHFFIIPFNGIISNFNKDREGKIWACSDSGLCLFDDETKTFITVQDTEPFIEIYDLVIDNSNHLWISGKNSIIKYDIKNMSYETYDLGSYSNDLGGNSFLVIDGNSTIWTCLRNGVVLYYKKELDSFIPLNYKYNINKYYVTSFSAGFDNSLLIGTDGYGLISLDIVSGNIYTYNHYPDNKESLSSNTIYSIFADKELGILWLGSYMGGIDYHSQYNKGFRFLYHVPYNSTSIINSNVRSLLINGEYNIWVGTRQGISILDSSNVLIRNIDQKTLYELGILNPIITRIYQDPKGYIWICSYKGGVVLYDPKIDEILPVFKVYPLIQLPKNLGVFDVLMDSKSNFWFATDGGTYLYPYNKPGFVFHEDFSKDIIEDRAGRIFIGTAYNGLYILDGPQMKIIPVIINLKQKYNEFKRINTLFEDKNGNIWIGTGGAGVIRYKPSNQEASLYSMDEGLPDNYVAGIIEDNDRDIWVTTYNGLSKLNNSKNKFKQVYFDQSINGKEFNPNSIDISSGGVIYVGSINGLLTFNTKQYTENPYLPEVIFTDLIINNKNVVAGQKNALIDTSIMRSNNINLKHFQNSIRLTFTAPLYHLGDKVKFYYRFENKNSEWTDIRNSRSLHFVNLDPGDYFLNVKAENSDGYSKEGYATLYIHIKPPYWKSKVAYSLYVISIIGLILLLSKMSKVKLDLKYQVLLQRSEKEKQEEINQARVRSFTDISHEFGTSLALINIPLETLSKIEDDSLKKRQLDIINRNVSRMLLLVKKIIGLRKVETGNMPLLAEQDDIIGFVKSICTNYEALARRKKIKFLLDFPIGEIDTWFDKEKIEFILNNLLSNAFKFEPENGTVCLSISKERGKIKGNNKNIILIKVLNEGSYIPEDKLQSVFKRFYSGGESGLSSGIGLSLVKSYVDIHKGEIILNSDKIKGVEFEIRLPFGNSYLTNDEKKLSGSKYQLNSQLYVNAESEFIDKEILTSPKERYKILIVEDNIELKLLLKEHLQESYEIIEAKDGEEGYLKAKNFLPDLVITDLVMPQKDGLELCYSIKEDLDIGHIPVIILTAKEVMEDQIKGIEAGADAYITKPFSITYLNSVIYNLIELRKKLRNKYYSVSEFSGEPVEIKSMDENFLEKAFRVIEENIDNVQFGIPEFIDRLGISKYMLYSKIKKLTGQTPNDLIISYRLKKAAHILKNKEISDVDLYSKLGFNDVAYFRKCFKKHFGMTPSYYIKTNRFNSKN